MKIISAKYLKSVFNLKEFKDSGMHEYVFAGRSNVGKSTLINTLCQKRNMAKTSSIPGKTQSVNYFIINENMLFVDLPGYGFAKSSKKESLKWKSLIEKYFDNTESIKMVFLLSDIRHGLLKTDLIMINWLEHRGLPYSIILTKSDKVSNNEKNNNIKQIQKELNSFKYLKNIIAVSCKTKTGINNLLDFI